MSKSGNCHKNISSHTRRDDPGSVDVQASLSISAIYPSLLPIYYDLPSHFLTSFSTLSIEVCATVIEVLEHYLKGGHSAAQGHSLLIL